MREPHRHSADRVRSLLERGWRDPEAFREELIGVPREDRDGWVDRVLGLGELPDDDPQLPRNCVPYLPCSVDALLRVVDRAPVRASDVFVDIGAGVGRAAAVVSLLTGAAAIGIEIQPRLVAAARELVVRVTCIEGDAASLAEQLAIGSVFFLYCPFSGPRLTKLIADLEPISQARAISVCCVDVPLPPCDWLAADEPHGNLAIYRSAAVRSHA